MISQKGELYMKMTFNSALKTFLFYTSYFVLNTYNLLAENLSIFPDSSELSQNHSAIKTTMP